LKYLENYYIGDLAEKDKPLSYNFSPMFKILCETLQQNDIEKEADKQSYVLLAKAFFTMYLIFFGYYLWLVRGVIWGTILCGWGFGWMGMNIMHDANHQGTAWTLYNVLGGWSLQILGGNRHVWTYSHIKHHAKANQIDDPDTLQPWVRYRADGPKYAWGEYQHVYAWFLYSLTIIGFRTQAIGWVLDRRNYKDVYLPKESERYYYISLVLVPLTLFIHYVLPCIWWGVGYGLCSALITDLIAGNVVTWVFQVNHLTIATHLAPGTLLNPKHDWCIDQIQGSNDFRMGSSDSWWNWLITMHCGGLNYQIEHHLFPCLPHMTMPFVSKFLQPLCDQFGATYTVHSSPLKAISSHYALLKHFASAP